MKFAMTRLRQAAGPTLLLLALHPADAQDTSAMSDDIETVVVTGRAGVEDIRKVEVSYAITTISSESLRMDAPLGVADALGSVPGFWVESSGGEAQREHSRARHSAGRLLDGRHAGRRTADSARPRPRLAQR